MTKIKISLGITLLLFGLITISIVIFFLLKDNEFTKIDSIKYTIISIFGVILTFLGYLTLSGQKVSKFGYGKLEVELGLQGSETPKRELEPEVLEQRQKFSSQKSAEIPGTSAPEFHVLEDKLAFEVTPCSDPMTPMYTLDNNFRIIDWNNAFSACFDRTMEGRRGLNVLEWTYFLENYEEVLDHGIKTFSDPENFPRIDIETIRYNSRAYGPIEGIKRAYQIPYDNDVCQGWLITIDPEFENQAMAQKYLTDLFSSLHLGLMWSEYALSYDVVLNRSNIYPHLINTVVGNVEPGPSPIASNTKVLDLGAGTGNITSLLTDPSANRLIVALDNNTMMLNVLRRKCKPYLRQDAEGAGVIAIKQDITSLYGLKDKFFDVVVINNVLYSLESNAVEHCLKDVYRVLCSGGEVRISEPHKNANASKVLKEIKIDLQQNRHFEEVQAHYQKVKDINELSLSHMLNKWNIEDMEGMLKKIGFSEITFKMDKTYARQSFLICAKK